MMSRVSEVNEIMHEKNGPPSSLCQEMVDPRG